MKRVLLCFLLLFAFFDLKAQTSLDSAVYFVVTDVDGVNHNLFDYLDSGKIVVIDFFTVTCGPCTTTVPEISSSFLHFGCNSGNVIFLGINWGASNTEVTDFGKLYKALYPEISGEEGNGNHVVSDYGVLSYPSVILILPDHSIAEQYIWPPASQTIDSLVLKYGGTIMDCSLGSETLKSDHMPYELVYPANDAQSLSIACYGSRHPDYVEIYSSASALISKSRIFESAIDDKVSFQIPDLPSGMYILKLFSDSSCIGSLKLIK